MKCLEKLQLICFIFEDLFDYIAAKCFFLYISTDNKQLLDEVEHDIMNYQNRGLCYLPKPKAEADNQFFFVSAEEPRYKLSARVLRRICKQRFSQ